MSQSKRYKGKACAYCGAAASSSTNDHVIARAFFLEEDRGTLPHVPACAPCNNRKSQLEHYVSATLMIGSQHPDGNRYRQNLVRPRLDANAKLRRELKLDEPFEWLNINGVLQRMKAIRIDAGKVTELMHLIVLGLYQHHFGAPLSTDFLVDAKMYPPERESALFASVAPFFPAESVAHEVSLGRGSFIYSVLQSPANLSFTVWQLRWHGGIRLHGEDDAGTDRWWAFTRPTQEAVRLAQERMGAPAKPDGL